MATSTLSSLVSIWQHRHAATLLTSLLFLHAVGARGKSDPHPQMTSTYEPNLISTAHIRPPLFQPIYVYIHMYVYVHICIQKLCPRGSPSPKSATPRPRNLCLYICVHICTCDWEIIVYSLVLRVILTCSAPVP